VTSANLPGRDAEAHRAVNPEKAAIQTDRLTRRFGPLAAVDEVSLRVQRREIFGLLGPNGAGKSTMIKMLTTLLPATAGRARVAGLDVGRAPGLVRRHIGYVPQALSADGALTGHENLIVSARLYHLPAGVRSARIHEALALVGLTEAADHLVREYSGGMIRRLEIAQAMLHRPAVLFMDEPTVGLDPAARQAVWEQIRRVRESFGTTVFLTTHYMEEAEALCDRVGMMHRGRLAAVGAPADLKAQLGARLGEAVTLEDVFMDVAGATIETGGSYREVLRTRSTARRLS
jgi:ABC-2 type transport system ATP-binding protein